MRNKNRAASAIQRTGSNGRYCRCVAHNGVLYIGGITSVDLEADIKEQTADILRQLDKLLTYHGTGKENLLTADVYLQDINSYPEFNAVWESWVVDGHEPTWNVVGLNLAIPGYHLKVSVTAALND